MHSRSIFDLQNNKGEKRSENITDNLLMAECDPNIVRRGNVYEKNEQHLKEKLEKMQHSGVSLFLEGKESTPEIIANKCVCEDQTYMADYVLDDSGTLKELRYDRVTDWK